MEHDEKVEQQPQVEQQAEPEPQAEKREWIKPTFERESLKEAKSAFGAFRNDGIMYLS